MPFQNDDQRKRFIEVLDNEYDWPDYYTFKFIVKKDNREELLDILKNYEVKEKDSSKGNYISVSFRTLIKSSEEVCTIYELVKKVDSIISL